MRGSRQRGLAWCVGLALAGCASTPEPVKQLVRVDTPRCAPARCTLSNDLGSWQVPRTPGEVTVLVSSQPLKAVCVAEGGIESSAGAPASRQPDDHSGAAAGATVGAAVGLALGAAALAVFPPLGLMAIQAGALAGTVGGGAADAGRNQYRYPPQISIVMPCGAGQDAVDPAPTRSGGVGVAIRGLSAAEARAAGVGDRGGVLVTRVGGDGAAAAAGLREGDIVLAANGRATDDAGDLEQVVLGLGPGGALALQVWREGRVVDLSIRMPGVAP